MCLSAAPAPIRLGADGLASMRARHAGDSRTLNIALAAQASRYLGDDASASLAADALERSVARFCLRTAEVSAQQLWQAPLGRSVAAALVQASETLRRSALAAIPLWLLRAAPQAAFLAALDAFCTQQPNIRSAAGDALPCTELLTLTLDVPLLDPQHAAERVAAALAALPHVERLSLSGLSLQSRGDNASLQPATPARRKCARKDPARAGTGSEDTHAPAAGGGNPASAPATASASVVRDAQVVAAVAASAAALPRLAAVHFDRASVSVAWLGLLGASLPSGVRELLCTDLRLLPRQDGEAALDFAHGRRPAPLRGLTWLTLDLGASKKALQSADLASLRGLTALRHLDLVGWRSLENVGLKHVGKVTSLISLRLSGCTRVSVGGLVHLSRLTQLRRLDDALLVHASDAALKRGRLSSLRGLTSLDLRAAHDVSAASLVHCAGLTALRELDLSRRIGICSSPETSALSHLAGLTALRSLNLFMCFGVRGSALAYVGGLASLLDLYLSMCTFVGDDGLANLRPLTRLTRLELSMVETITDEGGSARLRSSSPFLPRLFHLLSCPGCLHARLCRRVRRGARGPDRDLPSLSAPPPPFSDLQLDSPGCACQSRRPIAPCESGRRASVGLAHIGALTALSVLHLDDIEGIGSAGLASLRALSALTELSLSGCIAVDDEALKHVCALTALVTLNLGECSKVRAGSRWSRCTWRRAPSAPDRGRGPPIRSNASSRTSSSCMLAAGLRLGGSAPRAGDGRRPLAARESRAADVRRCRGAQYCELCNASPLLDPQPRSAIECATVVVERWRLRLRLEVPRILQLLSRLSLTRLPSVGVIFEFKTCMRAYRSLWLRLSVNYMLRASANCALAAALAAMGTQNRWRATLR